MRIIIVGAGEVGFHIAGRLAVENKEVTVIDLSPDALKRVAEHTDVKTIQGSGASPRILEEAGITSSDIFLAVTDSDEINLIACFFADRLAPDVLKLARIRGEDYTSYQELLTRSISRLGTIINPDTEVVEAVLRLMSVPGAVEINEFAEGMIKLIGVGLGPESVLPGTRLKDLRQKTGDTPLVIAALVRGDELIIPSGDDTIQPGDVVYFVCAREDQDKVLKFFGIQTEPLRDVLIVGGGNIGFSLARRLEEINIHVKLIERDMGRCRILSESLDKTIVLQGDGTNQELLQEENVHGMDMVVAVTGNEETNILSCLLAKRLGARKTITRVNKFEYLPLVTAIGINHLVCPRLQAINSILHFIRLGRVISTASIKGEEAEAMEVIAQQDSEIVGKPIKDLGLPRGALVLCFLRGDNVVIPTGFSVIQPQDRLIILTTRKSVPKVEKKLVASRVGYA